jgi:hypothetical protein
VLWFLLLNFEVAVLKNGNGQELFLCNIARTAFCFLAAKLPFLSCINVTRVKYFGLCKC